MSFDQLDELDAKVRDLARDKALVHAQVYVELLVAPFDLKAKEKPHGAVSKKLEFFVPLNYEKLVEAKFAVGPKYLDYFTESAGMAFVLTASFKVVNRSITDMVTTHTMYSHDMPHFGKRGYVVKTDVDGDEDVAFTLNFEIAESGRARNILTSVTLHWEPSKWPVLKQRLLDDAQNIAHSELLAVAHAFGLKAQK